MSKATTYRHKINKTKINLWLDIGVFVALVAAALSAFIDTLMQKWLAGGLVIAVSIHLALHWPWIEAISKRFLKKMPRQVRLKAIVDVLLLAVFILLVTSGGVVSLIYAPRVTHFHSLCSYLFIGLIALHLALNRKWIANSVKRVFSLPLTYVAYSIVKLRMML